MRRSIALLLLWFWAASFCAAQKPNVTHAKVQELSASSGLKPAFDSIVQKQDSPAWIGYRISTKATERTMCCFDSWDDSEGSNGRCCMGCRVESGKGNSFNGTVSDCSPPEPLPYSFVFFRVENHQVGKIRNYSPGCPLDFADLPLYWLENVNQAQSVELLTDLALKSDSELEPKKGMSNSAVMSIALHDDPSADRALEKFLQPSQPERLREHTAFWVAVERGKPGVELLRKYIKNDQSDRVREKGTFHFYLSKEPEALQDLIGMARNDPSPHVRGQAIFWLAQKGGKKIAGEISAAIENDPETQVKKRAVFSLAQMKDGEGVPMLIELAKNNKNPVVRKEAVRWLGMTHDARAVDFLEQILTK